MERSAKCGGLLQCGRDAGCRDRRCLMHVTAVLSGRRGRGRHGPQQNNTARTLCVRRVTPQAQQPVRQVEERARVARSHPQHPCMHACMVRTQLRLQGLCACCVPRSPTRVQTQARAVCGTRRGRVLRHCMHFGSPLGPTSEPTVDMITDQAACYRVGLSDSSTEWNESKNPVRGCVRCPSVYGGVRWGGT